MVSFSNRGKGGRRGNPGASSSLILGGSSFSSNHKRIPWSWIGLTLATVAALYTIYSLLLARRHSTVFIEAGGNLRIFGPSSLSSSSINSRDSPSSASASLRIQTFSASEQRAYLEEHGFTCQQSFAKYNHSSLNLLVQRFDELPPAYATELWKYCVLYVGTANLYWDNHNVVPLLLLEDIWLDLSSNKKPKANWAITLPQSNAPTTTTTREDFLLNQPPLHHSVLQISEPRSKTALGMMRYLLEAERLTPIDLHETLSLFVANDLHKKRGANWNFFTATCLDIDDSTSSSFHNNNNKNKNDGNSPPLWPPVHPKQPHPQRSATVHTATNQQHHFPGNACAATHGEPCCQVFSHHTNHNSDMPILALRHSRRVAHEFLSSSEALSSHSTNPLPYAVDAGTIKTVSDASLGMPVADLPYVATVRAHPTNAPPATVHETPNYFDILLRNNCLPHDKECFKCLKLGYKEGDEGGDCRVCAADCPCYCSALCQVRPPPKRLAAVWDVTLPRYKKDPSRLVPRVIHQTWFEPVTKEKYPNMSRLIESFRQSGWEYEFYDDDRAAQFLSAHFPPAVREAYDALIPGAFKADLFRYCVLLIRGGVYADMDILLESNLDEAIDGSIGFMVPQDSPGETIGHRSCLWNGLMSVAPGHPFLAQTIQNVVNNVRNRFTSVDYDDMLCPNPILSVSHTVDTLFTCGPCILGASINDVLQRHRQTGFEYGDIDLFETERQKYSTKRSIAVPADDPRWLIPGRTIILRQNKEDMGSHRFTHAAANHIIATTDMPEYDDRPKTLEHYSKSHVKFGVYGLSKLYRDSHRANEEVELRVFVPS